MDDESGESMELMEEVPLKVKGLGKSELERLVRGWTERSRELSPEEKVIYCIM